MHLTTTHRNPTRIDSHGRASPRAEGCRVLRILGLLFALALWLAAGVPSAHASADRNTAESFTELRDGILLTRSGERAIELPHRLESGDFDAEGGRVLYRLELDLAALPEKPLGVHVRKISLSGALRINGRSVAACGNGPLEELRCLHRPQLMVPPPDVWRAGRNTLEFEVFANGRQMNGLGRVTVGDAHALAQGPFRTQMLWQVETIHALTWITLTLAVLSLAVWAVLRTESVYLWFGLASLANAANNLNVLVTSPSVGFETYSWFVFASRMVSVPLMLLTMLAFFGKETPLTRRALVASAIVAPALLWALGNALWVVLALYVPLQLAGLIMTFAMARWALRSKRPLEILMTLSFGSMYGLGLLDYVRLGGRGAFEGVYLITYASASVMAVTGATLVSLLASALMTARHLTATLDREVAARTADLEQANAKLEELSATDALTGIANRRRFDEALDAQWRRACRGGDQLSLLMIDVDHFKHYNDALGHLAGDDCLKRVAQTLRWHARRADDEIARYGGEEFALLTRADSRHARLLAEHLREAVFDAAMPHPDSPVDRVTISVGVATISPRGTQTPADLIRLADEALYAAKRGGRNRVEGAEAG
ncbi:MAG: hypothetical protein RIS35_675 [Pseudomonadota bacterium]|jgi:diguanylate cyclase (GGDEF)-like protein